MCNILAFWECRVHVLFEPDYIYFLLCYCIFFTDIIIDVFNLPFFSSFYHHLPVFSTSYAPTSFLPIDRALLQHTYSCCHVLDIQHLPPWHPPCPSTPAVRPMHISPGTTGSTTWSCQSCCTALDSRFPPGWERSFRRSAALNSVNPAHAGWNRRTLVAIVSTDTETERGETFLIAPHLCGGYREGLICVSYFYSSKMWLTLTESLFGKKDWTPKFDPASNLTVCTRRLLVSLRKSFLSRRRR